MKFIKCFPVVLFFVLPVFLFAQSEKVDQAVMTKIRNEGLNNSKVMDIAFHLTELSGPRITNSSGFMRAANYANEQFTQWGMVNSKLDPWGDFGKGWELEKSYISIASPWYRPLIAYPKTWSTGTNGLQSGDVLLIAAKDTAELEAYRGKLKGKILIMDNLINFQPGNERVGSRFTDEELQKMSQITVAEDTAAIRRRHEQHRDQNVVPREVIVTLKKMAEKENAIALLSSAPQNYGGTILVLQAGPYKITDSANFTEIAVGLEDYNMIVRLLRDRTPVKMDVEIKTKFQTADTKGYNIIAEIPGTDKNLKGEVVMLGAHLDSWPAAVGATDDAAGACVMMEAVRILNAIRIHPKRTIRIALWSGEEEGLLGSRAYVKKTFGDPATMKLLPAYDKFYVYFNLDNGTGKIRGIHLQGNEAVRKIFEAWFAPFNDLGAKTITLRNTGSTDHISFDAIGLPAFQFIQDPLISQHSNMDSYDHLSPDDLKQSATIVAGLVYDAAMRDQEFPRKPLPKPLSVDPITGSHIH
jgi:carboxypeptidase Q